MSKQDPTGQGKNRRKAYRKIASRLNDAQKTIKSIIRDIPVTTRRQTPIANAKQTTVYEYQVDQEQLNRQVRQIIAAEVIETDMIEPPANWYLLPDVEMAYRQGTVEEKRDFDDMVAAAIATGAISLAFFQPQGVEQLLFSDLYRRSLKAQQIGTFNAVKSMSETAAAQVLQRINSGFQAGLSKRIIVNRITERFDVAKSSAKRITQTEINAAYNNAKMDATRILANQAGLRAGVIHISALLPTTRPHHAARHGNAYTVDDQNAWWDSDANRINCYCSTRSVLIDSSGNVVQRQEQEKIQEERSFFGDLPVSKTAEPKKAIIEPHRPAKSDVAIMKKAKESKPIKKLKRSKNPASVDSQKLKNTDSPPSLTKVKLTGDESAYVEYYKGQGFYKSNEILRNPSSFGSVEVESASKMRDSINSAVMKSPVKSDGILYRGISSNDVFLNAENLIGKTIPITTPQSTSTGAGGSLTWSRLIRTKDGNYFSAKKDSSVIFKIRVKKGQHALDMESLSMGNTGEREVLLGSMGKYKVRNVRNLTDGSGNTTGKVIEVDYEE